MTQQLPQYDFYATPTGAPSPAPAATATPSAPAYGTAVNQFGTPLGVPGASLPAAAAAAAPTRASGGVRVPGWLWRWGLGLAVAAVLGLFGVGRMGFLDVFDQPLEAPATLAGLPPTPSELGGEMRLQAAAFGIPEDAYVVETYAGPSTVAVLLALDVGLDAEELRTLVTAGDPSAVTTLVQEATCRDVEQQGVQLGVCASADGDRTVMVVHGPGGSQTAHTTLLEAWDAFD